MKTAIATVPIAGTLNGTQSHRTLAGSFLSETAEKSDARQVDAARMRV